MLLAVTNFTGTDIIVFVGDNIVNGNKIVEQRVAWPIFFWFYSVWSYNKYNSLFFKVSPKTACFAAPMMFIKAAADYCFRVYVLYSYIYIMNVHGLNVS